MPKTVQIKIGHYHITGFSTKEINTLYKEIFTNSTYDFRNCCSQNSTILDIGAYIGISTLWFVQKHPQTHIVAIEPNPQAFELLKYNLTPYHTKITFVNKAIANKIGKRSFYIDTEGWGSTNGFVKGSWRESRDSSEISVDTITLESLLSSHPNTKFIKMDIEGAEQTVLKSSYKILKQSLVQHIIVEYHPTKNQQFNKVTRYIRKAGFEIIKVAEDRDKMGIRADGEQLRLLYCQRQR